MNNNNNLIRRQTQCSQKKAAVLPREQGKEVEQMESCDGTGRSPYHIPKELQIVRNADRNGQPETVLAFSAFACLI